ncbi:uncharacterized protein LOC125500548 isoform X2 [Athalia rosae]|uniref:uncharacterized protein LOC125500548 isoform X2 n=1 Tax=Athalia rosae TaxID=37344 RepID=UPI002033A22D|nr:uncharacterized protein LOC125500548 isoform X2 [Athalia rosae]
MVGKVTPYSYAQVEVRIVKPLRVDARRSSNDCQPSKFELQCARSKNEIYSAANNSDSDLESIYKRKIRSMFISAHDQYSIAILRNTVIITKKMYLMPDNFL